MRIAVFGATGLTGVEVVRRALGRGHSVAALCRNAPEPSVFGPGVDLIEGSPTDPGTVKRAVRGAEAVICVLGPRAPFTDVFCARATRVIVESMKALGVRRLICQTGALVGDYRRNRTFFFEGMGNFFNRRRPAGALDRIEQEREVLNSGLEWTLVKPPRLTQGPARGSVQASEGLVVGMLSSLSRADLADFLLDLVASPAEGGKRIFVKSRA